MSKETFSMGDLGYSEGHVKGDIECDECWHNPKKCKECDDGLVHTCFGDENYDGDYWLYYKCDGCGSTDGDY